MNTQLGAPTAALRAHEELFAYWAGLRRPGALPCRADLDPAAIKRHLPALSLTKVVAGDWSGRPRDYRMRLAGIAEILAHTLGGGIAVRVETSPGLPPLLADKGQLETVLINLATNGRDVDLILGYDVVLAPFGESVSGIRAA